MKALGFVCSKSSLRIQSFSFQKRKNYSQCRHWTCKWSSLSIEKCSGNKFSVKKEEKRSHEHRNCEKCGRRERKVGQLNVKSQSETNWTRKAQFFIEFLFIHGFHFPVPRRLFFGAIRALESAKGIPKLRPQAGEQKAPTHNIKNIQLCTFAQRTSPT